MKNWILICLVGLVCNASAQIVPRLSEVDSIEQQQKIDELAKLNEQHDLQIASQSKYQTQRLVIYGVVAYAYITLPIKVFTFIALMLVNLIDLTAFV
jgi:hypothetical protein